MSDEAKLNSCLNLMRRLPPSSVENSLAGLIEMVPGLTDELLTHVDQPLKVQKDPKSGKSYVLCDYNRDGDSYRSPWTNEYFPAMADGFVPSKKLRDLEVTANSLFDIYRKLYFEGGYSSAYFFDTDEKSDDSFGACFLIHKDVEQAQRLKKGWWDSTHVFEVVSDKDNYFVYKLTTTVMISMVLSDDKVGNVDLSGLRTQQDSKRLVVDAESPHVANMAKCWRTWSCASETRSKASTSRKRAKSSTECGARPENEMRTGPTLRRVSTQLSTNSRRKSEDFSGVLPFHCF